MFFLIEVQVHSFSEENIRRQLQEQLDANAARPVVRWSAVGTSVLLLGEVFF